MLVQVKENRELGTVVSGRDLHHFLESKQAFTDWAKARIAKYGFIENEDYLHHKVMIQLESGAKTVHDYIFTLDCAKELAMVEGNEKGKEIRRYFIEFEKKAKALMNDPLEILKQQVRIMEEQRNKLEALEERVTRTITSPTGFFTVAGYASMKGVSMGITEASKHGRALSSVCKGLGVAVETMPDPRFGRVNVYPMDILEQYFGENGLI